jgi:hypothetical protein
MKTIFFVILGLFLNSIVCAEAPLKNRMIWAEFPVENTKIRSFYILAFNEARHVARRAWKNMGYDCTMTIVFIQLVGESVDDVIKKMSSEYPHDERAVEDFSNGYIDGLVEVLEQVVNRCVGECNLLGEAMGEWAAKMFCFVSKRIQKIPTFTNQVVNIRGVLCRNAYRIGCESNFIGITSSLCPKYANIQNQAFMRYYRAGDNGCFERLSSKKKECINLAKSDASDEKVVDCFKRLKCMDLAKSDASDDEVMRCFKSLGE